MSQKLFVLLLTAFVASLTACSSKEEKKSEKTDMKNVPQYDAQNVQTFKGKVAQTFQLRDPQGQEVIGIMLDTSQGTIPVILGPCSYMQGVDEKKIAASEMEVTGSVVYNEGRILVIAQTVKIDGYALELRDKKGAPLWHGWKKD